LRLGDRGQQEQTRGHQQRFAKSKLQRLCWSHAEPLSEQRQMMRHWKLREVHWDDVMNA
jgi:hypothetical protein